MTKTKPDLTEGVHATAPPESDVSSSLGIDEGQRLRVLGHRHLGRWMTAAALLVLVAMGVNLLVSNPAFQWDVVARYMTDGTVLKGLGVTVQLTAIGMVLGSILGVVLAAMRISANPILRWVSSAYSWFFRGTPVLVQLVFWYNLASLVPRLSLGIPFGPSFVSFETNQVMTPFAVAIVGLSLNEAAYMAEIVRGGILAVDKGQVDAATALGMTPRAVMRRIILPQAMRVIVPPTGNEVIGMLKYTSLASVIALPELLQSVSAIYTQNFLVIPLLIVASLWYLIATTILSIAQHFLEQRFGRGYAKRQNRPPRARNGLLRHGSPSVIGVSSQRG